MRIDIKAYLSAKKLTIYKVAKKSGYGYTTLHKSFNKQQTSATSLNLRDLDALAQHRSNRCGKFFANWKKATCRMMTNFIARTKLLSVAAGFLI